MRFLCLHGAGTNSDIFELQAGGLLQILKENGHEFHFVNGQQDAKIEKQLEDFDFEGPFYNHYSRGEEPGPTVLAAFKHTKDMIKKHGPFDGVLGFSQGAALAAALVIHHSKTRPQEPALFKVAVFICGAAPWDPAGTQRIVRENAHPIMIPTANIVGKLDPLYPESLNLFDLCEPSQASFYDHGLGHQVPFQVVNTEEMARGILEAIAKTKLKSDIEESV